VESSGAYPLLGLFVRWLPKAINPSPGRIPLRDSMKRCPPLSTRFTALISEWCRWAGHKNKKGPPLFSGRASPRAILSHLVSYVKYNHTILCQGSIGAMPHLNISPHTIKTKSDDKYATAAQSAHSTTTPYIELIGPSTSALHVDQSRRNRSSIASRFSLGTDTSR
jgi:hypothetical protein